MSWRGPSHPENPYMIAAPRLLLRAAPALLAALLVSGCAPRSTDPPPSDPSYLRLSQDESTTEEAIAQQLKARGIQAEVGASKSDPNDKFVTLRFHQEGMPDWLILIDTQVSGKRPDGTATERVVLVALLTSVRIPPEARPMLLTVLNRHHRNSFAGTFSVDPQGDVTALWPLNIASPLAPLHIETIVDAAYRLSKSWEALFPKIRAAFQPSRSA